MANNLLALVISLSYKRMLRRFLYAQEDRTISSCFITFKLQTEEETLVWHSNTIFVGAQFKWLIGSRYVLYFNSTTVYQLVVPYVARHAINQMRVIIALFVKCFPLQVHSTIIFFTFHQQLAVRYESTIGGVERNWHSLKWNQNQLFMLS